MSAGWGVVVPVRSFRAFRGVGGVRARGVPVWCGKRGNRCDAVR